MQSQSIQTLISAEEIQKRVQDLATEICEETIKDQDWVILVLLKGALFFASDLCRHLPEHIQMECVRVSSYKGQLQSTGQVDFGVFPEIQGRNILVIDDILDTGLTLERVSATLLSKGAAQIKTCVLLTKQHTQTHGVKADYTGFTIPKAFVVGYGLDYQEKLRNLPYIGELN